MPHYVVFFHTRNQLAALDSLSLLKIRCRGKDDEVNGFEIWAGNTSQQFTETITR